MQLEDYVEFEKTADYEVIRAKGSRINIEILIHAFQKGETPAWIQEAYPTLSLEQVYGIITYYLHNQAEIDAYIRHSETEAEVQYQEYLQKEPAPVIKRLRALKAEIAKGGLAAEKGRSEN